jgi:DNA (cytosine-5)-methyltransferase 1
MPRKKDIGVTLTDLFCGAGGSSEGAAQAGATPYLALNHWARAIETHNTNFPDCHHDCTDVQASDPRRYPSTNILIASPECTNHSLAKGQKRQPYKKDLFGNQLIDPADERSRATMWDVVRFAEYHRYELCIIENVVDAAKWELFDEWLSAMHKLGYRHEIVYFNSQFAFPTPQSRDRMYVVFWKKGNRKPNLDFTPPAPCQPCGAVVNALQTWKSHKRWGRYGAKRQYLYTCPKCRNEVTPYFFAAMNAIDWSIQAERIGDRKRPLQPKTLERIKYGLEKYGRNPLVVTHHSTPRVQGMGESLPTVTTLRNMMGIAAPSLVGMAYTQANGSYTYDGSGPMPTQTTRGDLALVGFLSKQFSGEGHAIPLTAPSGSHTTIDHHAVVGVPQAFFAYSGRNADATAISDEFGTFATLPHHTLIAPSFIAEMHGTSKAAPLTDSLMCIATGNHHALIRPDAIEAYCTATGQPRDLGELQQMLNRLEVEDLTFRMLKPHEIQRGMAFPDTYTVLGNSSEKIKQLGNAVTPPVMQMLVERAIQSLEAA